LIQELIRFRRANDDDEFKYRTLNLSSYLSLKDETQLNMNQILLQAATKIAGNVKDQNVKDKIKMLHELTYEEDGSIKGKLIMNVQPSIDENDNMEILKLPEEITRKHGELIESKEAKKQEIQKLKGR